LIAAATERLEDIQEKASGAKTDRVELAKAINKLAAG